MKPMTYLVFEVRLRGLIIKVPFQRSGVKRCDFQNTLKLTPGKGSSNRADDLFFKNSQTQN
jgi:hypothetical protein